MKITKKFTFDSAHKLENYEGKCKNLHGHTYTLFVTVEGAVDEKSGMVIDFGDLNKIVEEKVLGILDHSLLNDNIPQPTAENICIWIWERLKDSLNLSKIKLWENPDSYATYHGPKE